MDFAHVIFVVCIIYMRGIFLIENVIGDDLLRVTNDDK